MVAAIRLVLERENWQAGETRVAFQACDDTIEETGDWDEVRCRENAEAYAENPDLVGVIGTYNSGCASEIIPILNEAPDGGVAMVSPGNTLICLTQSGGGCEEDEPGVYSPSGQRNYARVVPNDASQGAGLAEYAAEQGIQRPFVVFAAEDPTSRGQGQTFAAGARALGMQLAGFDVYDPDAPDYTALMRKVEDSGADALFLGAILEQNGVQLINDKVSILGPNDGDVRLLAPDGFAQQSTINQAGEAARGLIAGLPGRTPESLTGPGAELVEELEAELDGEPVELFAPYAGQAAEVLLDAISTGVERSQVIEALFETRVRNGIVGSFTIQPSGDPSNAPISVVVAGDTFELGAEITPEAEVIEAAGG